MPNDREGQRTIVSRGLAAGVAMEKPAFHELDFRYQDDDWKADPLSWSRRRQDAAGGTGGTAPKKDSSGGGGDTRTPRTSSPVYQNDDDAAAASAIDWDDQCLVCIGLPADA